MLQIVILQFTGCLKNGAQVKVQESKQYFIEISNIVVFGKIVIFKNI